jgi:hypothetical protein
MHTQHRYGGRAEINSQYTTDSGVDIYVVNYIREREVKRTPINTEKLDRKLKL